MRAEENELLTRVGPDAPMGRMMREYWLPALLSSELTPGGVPIRLRLLGEDFLAFRSPDGRVGIIDHQCAHRCASLFYGRNEDGGMRCVYHGWKFDTSGQCIDMPSEPQETDQKHAIKLHAAVVEERYGVVWAYLGGRKTPPALPHFDLDQVDPSEISASCMLRECNWLQALEGDIDTCHVGFLHLGGVGPENFEKGSINYYRQLPENLAPRYEVLETEYGTTYAASRHAGPEDDYHRIGQFALPFWTMTPSSPLDVIRVKAWVPVDDHYCMLVAISGVRALPQTFDKEGKPLSGATDPIEFLPNSTDWYGRFRIANNIRNDHLIDRDVQRTKNYTGIKGIPVQDQAVTESMGPIVNRTKEHLGNSDRMIMQTRRKLMRTASAFADQGIAPPGIDDAEVYRYTRAGFVLIPKTRDWLDEYNAHRSEWSGGQAKPVERTTGRPVRASERV